MRAAIVLLTRDLRVHDHPALAAAAARAQHVVPLFVLDERILRGPHAAPNRLAFLHAALRDLDGSLAGLGARLVVRRGDVVAETMRVAGEVGAEAVFTSADVSAYARRRERRLERACAGERRGLVRMPGVTVVPPGELAPADGDHFRVFTPYHRRWSAAPRRAPAPVPRRLALPPDLRAGCPPPLADLLRGGRPSPELPSGGEGPGRRRLAGWTRSGLADYGERHDDLGGDGTSRLSPYLHFGCLSALEVVERLEGREGAEPFVRQVCWRDFHHQLMAANPRTDRDDLRPRGDRWRDDDEALAAWQEGRTGYPIVDAGMRQLAREGWMHNRARLIVGSFLAKDLRLDWRLGARFFMTLLVDGDVANNSGNWQWVAGTGADTRPNRVLNPLRQARRLDPDGRYVRGYVPELAGVPGDVHDLGPRRPGDYPTPIVDHAEAAARLRRER